MTEAAYWFSMFYWTQVQVWATIGTGMILTFTLVAILIQQRAYRKTQELQGFISIVDWLQREDIRKARRRVYQLKNASIDNWAESDVIEVEKVCHNFDVVGEMFKNKLIPKRTVATWDITIKRSWEIVKPLVLKYRKERPHPGLWDKYQWLAEEVFKDVRVVQDE